MKRMFRKAPVICLILVTTPLISCLRKVSCEAQDENGIAVMVYDNDSKKTKDSCQQYAEENGGVCVCAK